MQTVDVQVLMTSGLPKVNIVGLPERAVGESKERVRGALGVAGADAATGARLDQPRSGRLCPRKARTSTCRSCLALLVEMEVLPPDCLDGMLAMGELGSGRVDQLGAGALCPQPSTPTATTLSLICP